MRLRSATVAPLLAVVVWLALASVLAAVTSRVANWFVMTDELLYERLALSIDRLGTPLPHVHGQFVDNINQLYPLLLAVAFRHGWVLHGFHQAHVLNAFVITSAALPTFLLSSRVTGRPWLSLVAAIASACVVWVTLASFLLTEVAAYPAFMWALLALHVCATRPSPLTDVLAVCGIGLGVLARTQFLVLALVLVVALVGDALANRRVRALVREHRVLIALYVLGGAAGIALELTGHHVLGTYASTTSGNPLPSATLTSAPAHLATIALSTGLLPLLVGGGWTIANLRRSETHERHAFAWLAVVTIVALTIEVTSFDLRFGGGLVRDRYLFYLAPVLFVALAAGLSAGRTPRWSIAVPLVVVAFGFWESALATFQKLNADTPAAVIDDWLLRNMHGIDDARAFLILASVVLAAAFVEGVSLAGRRPVVVVSCALLLLALPAETAYAFKRLFAIPGTSGLPMTLDQSPVFEWVDRWITPNSDAMMVPYPVIRGDYWANIGYWWDLEFWNKSVDTEAAPPNEFSGTPPGSFPKVALSFDPRSGRASTSPNSYIAQAQDDVRYHVAGKFMTAFRGVQITFPSQPWHADWLTLALYPDGWTQPNVPASIRVFASPGQTAPMLRTLGIVLSGPKYVTRAVQLRSNAGSWKLGVTSDSQTQSVQVCVPARGYADVRLLARGVSSIPGDQTNVVANAQPRRGGVLVDQITLQPGSSSSRCAPSP